MKATVRDSQTLELVTPEDLGSYLSARAWETQRAFGEYGVVYGRTKDARKYELLVPTTRDVDDFPQRISDVLSTLEKFEERSQLEILSDLTTTRADVVRIRRPGAGDGTLPLEDGSRLFRSTHDMMLAVACAAVTPKPYYMGTRPGKAMDYIENARLGQSERGSYVVTVISPLPPRAPQHSLFGMSDPFERQVTRLLAKGLDSTLEASEYGLKNTTTEHFKETTADGVSANLLDAVLGLMGEHRSEVDVNFAWSPEIRIVDPPSRPLLFEPDLYPVIAQASDFLKSQELQEPIELFGLVVALRREQSEIRGRVTLLAMLPPKGQRRHVSLELDLENYSIATRAHDEKRPVYCKGELVRVGKLVSLRNVTIFSIAPEFEDDEGGEGPLFDE